MNCVDYFTGNGETKLLTGSDDFTAKVCNPTSLSSSSSLELYVCVCVCGDFSYAFGYTCGYHYFESTHDHH